MQLILLAVLAWSSVMYLVVRDFVRRRTKG